MMIVVPRKKLVLTILSSITAGSSWKKTGRYQRLQSIFRRLWAFNDDLRAFCYLARKACEINQLPLHPCVLSQCATCVPVGKSPPVSLILDDFFGKIIALRKEQLRLIAAGSMGTASTQRTNTHDAPKRRTINLMVSR
ncbi:hypothetical protein [Pseudomonas alvandae]|uniref:hypothetical protein n=1 Tax=Pseudomonas canavaninivorans TaxID=2842348 RepID=UPI00215E996C|nr:hypothetical protein [Pseudomonas canavaninivorans]UVM75529.1 hypothetical protein LOY40_03850 [Pseudomonas canavaninivorans]